MEAFVLLAVIFISRERPVPTQHSLSAFVIFYICIVEIKEMDPGIYFHSSTTICNLKNQVQQ